MGDERAEVVRNAHDVFRTECVLGVATVKPTEDEVEQDTAADEEVF